jgi:hypothetical protein
MISMKSTVWGSLVPTLGLVFLLGSATARAEDPTDIYEILQKALSSADEMIRSGQKDQRDPFIQQNMDFSDRIREAIELVSPETDEGFTVRGHLQMALSEAEKAAESANDGQMDDATNYALNALSHAEEANSLAQTLR